MNPFGEFLNLLNTQMTTPVPYGVFHLFFFVLSIVAGTFTTASGFLLMLAHFAQKETRIVAHTLRRAYASC